MLYCALSSCIGLINRLYRSSLVNSRLVAIDNSCVSISQLLLLSVWLNNTEI